MQRDSYYVHPSAMIEKGVKIGKGTMIWQNSHIYPNSKIGNYAFIAPGSVVTHDVPSHAFMMGAPAKQLGWVCKCGQALDFHLHCEKCGKNFNMIGNNIKEA